MRKLPFQNIESTDRSAFINMALKPLSAVLSLVYTPILLAYLGDEKYGLWATILSFITWINYFDIGIGNGLRNLLTVLLSEKNGVKIKKAISTAYVMLSVISFVILVFLICIAYIADWSIILSTMIPMRNVIIITFAFVCINFVLSLSNVVFYALHRPEYVSFRGCIAQFANIIGLIVLNHFCKGSLIALAILFGCTTTIVYIGNVLILFKKNKNFIPSIMMFDSSMTNEICGIGVQFFIIQMMGLLLFTVDNILITHYLGAIEATPFSIANKVFNTLFSAFAAFIVPYWARTAVAVSNKDINWIKKSIKKVLSVGCCFIGCYIIIGIFFKPVVKIWLQKELTFQPGLIMVMVIFYSIYTLLGVECQFINGTGMIKTQLIVYIIIGLLNIPFSILLGVSLGLGSVGIRIATTVLVLFAVIVLYFDLKRIINKLDKNILVLYNYENDI